MSKSSFYSELGRRVKKRRTELKLTQDALASELGLQRTSIANLETGLQRISAEAVVILASALRVSPAELLPSVSSHDEELVASIETKAPSNLRPYMLRALRTLR